MLGDGDPNSLRVRCVPPTPVSDILWDAVILGNTGTANSSLGEAAAKGVEGLGHSSALDVLAQNSPDLGLLVEVFSVSAIITSFSGAAFSLMVEFTHLVSMAFATLSITLPTTLPTMLSPSGGDGSGYRGTEERAEVKVEGSQDVAVKTAAAALVLVPPAIVSSACPDSFITALQYAGVYVDPLLYGIAPALMAYRLRSTNDHKSHVPGGSAPLLFLAALTAGYTMWQSVLLMG